MQRLLETIFVYWRLTALTALESLHEPIFSDGGATRVAEKDWLVDLGVCKYLVSGIGLTQERMSVSSIEVCDCLHREMSPVFGFTTKIFISFLHTLCSLNHNLQQYPRKRSGGWVGWGEGGGAREKEISSQTNIDTGWVLCLRQRVCALPAN